MSDNLRVSLRSPVAIWLASTAVLTAFLLAMTLPDLGRYPRVHGDDIWVMSASYKLATSGVFGSDMYRGFYDADEHYVIVLPVYPFLQGLSFTLAGAGIAQARLVTLISAVVVLWATTWLALRWYGPLAAVVAGLLLVLLRVNLVDLWPGTPLLSVGRSGRYDTTAVAFVWLTVVCLDLTIADRGRKPSRAYLTGAFAGLAALTQFFGAFAILIAPALLLWRGRPLVSKTMLLRLGVGCSAFLLSYAVYVALHWSDFRGQSTLIASRTGFHRPLFYINNLRDEPARYQHLVDADRIAGNGVATWLVVVAILPVLCWLAWRARRPAQTGDRLLLTSLLVIALALALVDSTNVPIYTIPLWPGVCIALAAAMVAGASWMRAQFNASRSAYHRPAIAISGAFAIALAGVVALDSIQMYRDDRAVARSVSSYEAVAEQIDAVIPEQAGVVGHQRWWWGLHERDYLALNALTLEWERQENRARSFSDLFDATGATALVIDDNARSEMGRYPEDLRRQIESFITDATIQAAVISEPTYGRFEIYLRQGR